MSYKNGPKVVTDGLIAYLDAGNTKSYPGLEQLGMILPKMKIMER